MVTDPYLPSDSLKETLEDADILVIGTNHSEYQKLSLAKLRAMVSKNCLICDIWNMFGTGKIIFHLNE